MYHSEHGQDRFLTCDLRYFHNKRNGVFFECGAIDGVITSNTLRFEQELGWSGLCVEANPVAFERLKENRRCAVEHAALCDRDDVEVEYVKFDGGLLGWGGIAETIEPQHWERIGKHIAPNKQERIRVPGITLHTLLRKHNLSRIDYLCLDIEGGEWPVLRAFDWDGFDIDIWDIEDNWGNYPITEYMQNHGYRVIARLGPSVLFQKATD